MRGRRILKMPHITINGEIFDVEHGKRLVLAIEESGIEIGHRCGGFARCTTCRVEFVNGEPETMTRAEFEKLTERGLFGQARLSCQIVCDHDMSVNVLMTADNQPQWNGDTGPTPETEVTPEAKWQPVAEIQAEIKERNAAE
jgi:ferredoxin